jgi:hypothetical protein
MFKNIPINKSSLEISIQGIGCFAVSFWVTSAFNVKAVAVPAAIVPKWLLAGLEYSRRNPTAWATSSTILGIIRLCEVCYVVVNRRWAVATRSLACVVRSKPRVMWWILHIMVQDTDQPGRPSLDR